MEKGYSTNVLTVDGSVEKEVFDVYIKPTNDETKVWIDNINVITNESNLDDVESSSIHSVDESFITNIDTKESISATYNTDDLKYREEILNNLVKKGLLEITDMNMIEGSNKGKEVMIENIQSLPSRSVSSSVSSPEGQEVVNTTIPIIKDVLDIITSST